jgi:hypothetical protein
VAAVAGLTAGCAGAGPGAAAGGPVTAVSAPPTTAAAVLGVFGRPARVAAADGAALGDVTVSAPVFDADDPEALDHPESGRWTSVRVRVVPARSWTVGPSDWFVRTAGGEHLAALTVGGPARDPGLPSAPVGAGVPAAGWLWFDVPPGGVLVLAPQLAGRVPVAEWRL